MEKYKFVNIATAFVVGSATIATVFPVHSTAATSLTSKISKAKSTMKKPYDRYINSTTKLTSTSVVLNNITKAKKAQKDANAAIKKAKLSSKQKKKKYAEIKAYTKYIERAQGYVNAYKEAKKATITFSTITEKLQTAIAIKDVSSINEQTIALTKAITAIEKKIQKTVYGAKVRNLLFKTFTNPSKHQLATLKAQNNNLFAAIFKKAKMQSALNETLDTVPNNSYVAIDLTGATEDLSLNTIKALNITIKGDLGGKSITFNTPNSDIINNATNVGAAIINDVSNNSFHQGSGTVQNVEMNDPNGGHFSTVDFTDLQDVDTASKTAYDTLLKGGIISSLSDMQSLYPALFARTAATLSFYQEPIFQGIASADIANDDPANSYALPFIAVIKQDGMSDELSSDEWDPVGNVTLKSLATFFVRGLGQQGVSEVISDNTISYWATGYVSLALNPALINDFRNVPVPKPPVVHLGENADVTLSGNFHTITASGSATVTVSTGTTVGQFVSNGNVTLTAPKSTIFKISGSGTVNPTSASPFNDNDVKNAGGNIKPDPTPVPTNPNSPNPNVPNPNSPNPNVQGQILASW